MHHDDFCNAMKSLGAAILAQDEAAMWQAYADLAACCCDCCRTRASGAKAAATPQQAADLDAAINDVRAACSGTQAAGPSPKGVTIPPGVKQLLIQFAEFMLNWFKQQNP